MKKSFILFILKLSTQLNLFRNVFIYFTCMFCVSTFDSNNLKIVNKKIVFLSLNYIELNVESIKQRARKYLVFTKPVLLAPVHQPVDKPELATGHVVYTQPVTTGFIRGVVVNFVQQVYGRL